MKQILRVANTETPSLYAQYSHQYIKINTYFVICMKRIIPFPFSDIYAPTESKPASYFIFLKKT